MILKHIYRYLPSNQQLTMRSFRYTTSSPLSPQAYTYQQCNSVTYSGDWQYDKSAMVNVIELLIESSSFPIPCQCSRFQSCGSNLINVESYVIVLYSYLYFTWSLKYTISHHTSSSTANEVE